MRGTDRHETYTYTLPSGATIEIENLPSQERGARDVAHGDKGESPSLEKILAPLGEVVELVFAQVKSAVLVPDQITLELGAALKGKSSLVIVSGETEATLKVTLSWTNPRS